MANKSGAQTFQTDWAQAISWAHSNGISANSYLPIYQQDATHLLTYGYPMSQADRINAIRTAAGFGMTQVPQDNPPPTDIIQNVRNNAEDIFSSLFSVHTFKNIFDSATNAVEHPGSQLIHPAMDMLESGSPFLSDDQRQKVMENFTQTVLGNHAPFAFVPGAYDAAELYRGKAGARELADNPLTAIMDIVPIGRVANSLISKTAIGEAVADRAGISAEELGKMGPVSTAFKLLGNKKTSTFALAHSGADQEAVWAQQSTGDLWQRMKLQRGFGAKAGELLRSVGVLESVGERQWRELGMGEYHQTWNKLTPEEKKAVNTYLQKDYSFDPRPDNEKLADLAVTMSSNQLDAIRATLDTQRFLYDTYINKGTLVMVKTAFGWEPYVAGPSSRSAPIIAANDQLEAAQNALHVGALRFNQLRDISQAMDGHLAQAFPQLDRLSTTIHESIKSSLPELSQSPAADSLRDALPTGQKFDRNAPLRSQNLENLLGLDEKVEQRVTRGRQQMAPFTGGKAAWGPAEAEAWKGARDTIVREGRTPSYPETKKLATDRLELLGQLQEVRLHAPVHATTARLLSEIVSPGGLREQMSKAFQDQRFEDLRDLARITSKKLHGSSFSSPTRSDALTQLVSMVDFVKKYANTRDQITVEMNKIWDGTARDGSTIKSGKWAAKKSLSALVKDADKAGDRFLKASVDNPPAIWDNYSRAEFSRQLMERESGRAFAKKAITHLREQGASRAALKELRQDPQALVEMAHLDAVTSIGNPMLPNVDLKDAVEIGNEVNKQIADLRAFGLEPLYLPSLNPWDADKTWGETMRISKTGVSREQASFEKGRTVPSSTIYDFEAGMSKAVFEHIKQGLELHLQSEVLPHYTFSRESLVNIIKQYFADDLARVASGADREMNVTAFYNAKFAEWNLQAYSPSTFFSITHPSVLGKEMFIDRDLAKALEDHRNSGAGWAMGTYDRVTSTFRTAILGYSPRFVAHVTVGGAVMQLFRADKDMFSTIPAAFKWAKSGQPPEDIVDKLSTVGDPNYLSSSVLRKHTTQEGGVGETVMKHAMGYSAGQFAVQEEIAARFGVDAARLDHPDWATHWAKVVPAKLFRTTEFAGNMYRAMSFLTGMIKAEKDGHFYTDEWDADSRQFIHVKREMSPKQAFHQAIQYVDKVNGDVLAMTPIERNVLTRIMPFWSWTKHVLKYVASYPADHPYRAMLLTQLARISQAEQNPALPIRTQLLFIFGENAQGEAHAIDTRFANPLRDTGTYLTYQGWLSSLNPVFTAIPSMVNPQFTFGTNVLYPNISYDAIYGTNEAQPEGGPIAGIEQVIPEVSALDAALNLSGQYSYLKGDHEKLTSKVFGSLNIPFLQEQSINLKQIMGNNEIDRYNQAKNASAAAWQSGNFSSLAGYSSVPDPRFGSSPIPMIAPSDLEAIYNQTAQAYSSTGLSPVSVTPELSNPTV